MATAPTCQHCQSAAVQVRYGHNYYLVCTPCGRNTVIDLACSRCAAPARIRKEGLTFHKEYKASGLAVVYHRNARIA